MEKKYVVFSIRTDRRSKRRLSAAVSNRILKKRLNRPKQIWEFPKLYTSHRVRILLNARYCVWVNHKFLFFFFNRRIRYRFYFFSYCTRSVIF